MKKAKGKVDKLCCLWSSVGDLPTCQLREFIWLIHKNDCSLGWNPACQRAIIEQHGIVIKADQYLSKPWMGAIAEVNEIAPCFTIFFRSRCKRPCSITKDLEHIVKSGVSFVGRYLFLLSKPSKSNWKPIHTTYSLSSTHCVRFWNCRLFKFH